MNHRDQSMSEVMIVLRSEYVSRFEEILEQLTESGAMICSVDQELGSIVASCESNRIVLIENMEFVQAIRTTFSYLADYPAGDPRDTDGLDRAPELDADYADD